MSAVAKDDNITHVNLTVSDLIEKAVARHEGELSNKVLYVKTGSRTGRSPKDRFIVRDEVTHNTVNWGAINQPISTEKFNSLWQKAECYINQHEKFVAHLQVGEDAAYKIPVEVITETAWHSLFAQYLFIRPQEPFNGETMWTILNAPGLQLNAERDVTNSDAILIINFSTKRILMCGLKYAGEMKKAMFTVMNYLLPEKNVLPMHCAANIGKNNDVALFFGLSGTGKTTLSADPERYLIGDDEHGWSEQGIFNFEGGCYAKCINLSEVKEPLIWQAIHAGSLLENVIWDPTTKLPDFDNDTLTQNTRAAYPRENIEQRASANYAGHPKAVIFLCCDLYGVLPPVALLTKEQAAYYFLSGYTALVGSTEVGQSEPVKPTFSTCFGAPFFPRDPKVYANLLLQRLNKFQTPVYLVNTGWYKGAYGQGGERFSIPITRAIISAILQGEVNKAEKKIIPGFNLQIPTKLNNINSEYLDPRLAWSDQKAYKEFTINLINKFIQNFSKFDVEPAIKNAGPTIED